MPTEPLLVLLIVLALAFTFLNGFNDSAAIVATMIASHALSARKALALAAVAELLGPLALGVAVATTIGRGVVDPGRITPEILVAALVGASLWGVLAGWIGLPISATHALVGGMVGAAMAAAGPGAVLWGGVLLVFLALAAAPILGLLVGYGFMKLILAVGRYLTPRVNLYLRRMQVATSALVAFSHGANDAQKGMGVIAAGLLAAGAVDEFVVPPWVVLACAVAIAAGVALGGRRTLRTLGVGIYTIRPIHGFAAQGTSAAIVLTASLLGGPASTTQVATSAIFGVGAAERISKVRWEVGEAILVAWLVTVPLAAAAGAVVYHLGTLVP